MTSPLVQRLLEDIDDCEESVTRACLKAELGCYWARVGEFQEAERLRSELRRDFGAGQSVRVSVLIMCIEALLIYFRELSPLARDRMARANLLSSAAKDARLIAFTSAWMAHIDFNLNRFETMASSIATCLAALADDDRNASCRVSLVLGDAHLFVGDWARSRAWYTRAHLAATKLGDHAAIGALTYNRAALHVANARLQQVIDPSSGADLALVTTEVQSAINYQAIAHLKSLDHLLQTARVGALMLQDRFSDVLPMIAELLKSPDLPPNSAQLDLLRADLALSLAGTGQANIAIQMINSIRYDAMLAFSPDDRILILSSIRRAHALCGTEFNDKDCMSDIQAAIVEHKGALTELTKLLTSFDQFASTTR